MPAKSAVRPHLTPPDVAREFRVSTKKVIEWIEAGELAALNLARRGCTRPRYSIPPESLEAFERARAVVPAAQPQRRVRRPTPPGVREFV